MTGRKTLALSVLLVGVLCALLAYNTPSAPGQKPTGKPLVFYCAAGIKRAVEPVVEEFMANTGTLVQLQYGGSGTLLANIDVSRSGDLYLAADSTYLQQAVNKGLVRERIPLATMQPVIGVKAGNPKNIKSVRDLLREDVRVALGSPDAASIGRQTRRFLEPTGEWEPLKARVEGSGVFKPTVNQVANDIKLGAVDAGVIWDATAAQYEEIDSIPVAAFAKNPQMIEVGVLSSSKQPTTALALARYLGARDRGLVSFENWGYRPETGDIWHQTPEILVFSGGVNRLAIQETIKEFQEREGANVLTAYNGCGILVGEMKAGKQPDLYLACDSSFMVMVHDRFVEHRDVSETDMVLLVRKGNPLAIKGLQDLARPGVRVAVANAKYSALGALTERLLTEANLYEKVKPNITYGDSPTADFLTVRVKTEREDVAIVYRANTIKVRHELDVVDIGDHRAKAVQPIAISKSTQHPRLCRRLADAIFSSMSRKRFEASGFRWRGGKPSSQAENK